MKPLQGVRILDLSWLLPGPYCTRLLGDMGAEVIKVEEPGRGDYLRFLPPFEKGASMAFEMLNRGKKSITLNLETKQGQEILNRLVTSADVFIEGFQAGTAKKLGCDFESLRKLNSRIVYCSLTGFGQTGPYKDLPGHDINFIALSGFLSLNGKTEPIVPGLQVGDLAGGMLAALTITTALFARQQRNEAQYIDASMLDALLSWLIIPMALHLGGEGVGFLTGKLPFYSLYRTLDSKLLAVAAIEPRFWEGLCKLIERPDLVPDQYSPDPRRTQVAKVVEAVFATKTRDEWFSIMLEQNLPCTPVFTLDEAVKDQHAAQRQMMLRKDQPAASRIIYVGSPCKISDSGPVDLSPSPKLGEHSAQLLRAMGYSDSEIQSFIQTGVV